MSDPTQLATFSNMLYGVCLDFNSPSEQHVRLRIEGKKPDYVVVTMTSRADGSDSKPLLVVLTGVGNEMSCGVACCNYQRVIYITWGGNWKGSQEARDVIF